MDGELAQLLAIVAHGNDAISRDAPNSLMSFQRENSTFKYVRSATFWENASTGLKFPNWGVMANDVSSWVAKLHERGTWRLLATILPPRHHRLPQHVQVAFAGGGHWAIISMGKTNHQVWTPRIEHAEGEKPWIQHYFGSSHDGPPSVQPPDTKEATIMLRGALDAAITFVEDDSEATGKCQHSDFLVWFQEALWALDGEKRPIPYHPDLLPSKGYNASVRCLLAAAVRAWVFGGMGSWNDYGSCRPDLEAEYDQVSRRLYDAVIRACIESVCAYDLAH